MLFKRKVCFSFTWTKSTLTQNLEQTHGEAHLCVYALMYVCEATSVKFKGCDIALALVLKNRRAGSSYLRNLRFYLAFISGIGLRTEDLSFVRFSLLRLARLRPATPLRVNLNETQPSFSPSLLCVIPPCSVMVNRYESVLCHRFRSINRLKAIGLISFNIMCIISFLKHVKLFMTRS